MDGADDALVEPKELARRADVPRQMIFNYLAAGRIKGIRSPKHKGRWMIPRGEAERWLAVRHEKAEAKRAEIKRQLKGIRPY